jgi:hypothetical protein
MFGSGATAYSRRCGLCLEQAEFLAAPDGKCADLTINCVSLWSLTGRQFEKLLENRRERRQGKAHTPFESACEKEEIDVP